MITGSKELIRDINSNLVLSQIVNSGPISRSTISKNLGLTKATVSAIVSDLIDKKLVLEIGSDDTLLGRKPILLNFNKKAGYAVSVDIDEHILSIMTSDLEGGERTLKQISTPRSHSQITYELITLLSSIIDSLPATTYGVVAIAIAIHGVTFHNDILFTPYSDLTSKKIANEIEEYFHVPVLLENEANLSVLGERTFEYNYPNITGISIHSGVGLGIIINNELYAGVNGYSGEIGHTIVEVNGKECPCGNRGCLEQYLSERSLLNELLKRKNVPNIDFLTFQTLYEKGDQDAIYIADQFVKYLTICVNNVANMFNPNVIIVNSKFTNNYPNLLTQVEHNLNSQMNNFEKLVCSSLKESSILLGGISVCIRTFLGIDIAMEYIG